MDDIYETLESATLEEVFQPSMADVVEKEQETRRIAGVEERPAVDRRQNGNGYLWENVGLTETLDIASPDLTMALQRQLYEAQIKLDEYEQTINEINYALARISKACLDYEAIAISRKSAMMLLSICAEENSIHQDEIGGILNTTDEWLSLAWLIKADLVKHTGSYLSITDRGRRIAEVAFTL